MALNLKSVLLLDNIDPECGRLLQNAKINIKTEAKLSEENLIAELQHHDGVIVRSATKLTEKVLDQCSHLKAIGRAGTGVDNINVLTATEKGIIVMNTPGGNTLSAAEQTCALICSVSRSIPQACAALKSGLWDRKTYLGNEVYGKTLAIIGLGRIGREVSIRMKSFGMNVIGFDPIIPKETAEEWGIGFYPLKEIWPKADYITVHTPLIPQTKNLIGEEALAKCKPSVKIINVARGGIVDEEALLKALKAGKCGGAGLDVFTKEPPINLELIQHPKVICTPHLGANTYEAQKRVAVEIAQQFIEMSLGQAFAGIVNMPELSQAGGGGSSSVWLKLAEYLGSLCAQLRGEGDTSIAIHLLLQGQETNKLNNILKCAILKGVLPKLSFKEKLTVNLVNAATIADRNGVTISRDYTRLDNIENAIRVQIHGSKRIHSVTGTVINNTTSLCEMEGVKFDPYVIMDKNVMFLKSEEVPLADLLEEISYSELVSVTVSPDTKFYAIKTRNTVKLRAKVFAML